MDVFQQLANVGSFLQGVTGCLLLFVTIVTIIFVVKQTREMNAQSRLTATSTYGSLYTEIALTMIKIDEIFTEKAYLRKYFYEDEPITDLDPKSDRYQEIMSMAETFLDFADMWVTLKNVAKNQHTIDVLLKPLLGWEKYFPDVLQCTAIRQLYDEHCDWWVDEIGEMIQKGDAKRANNDKRGCIVSSQPAASRDG